MDYFWSFATILDYWSLQLQDVEILVSIFTFTATTFLGFIIFGRDTKSWTHRLFLALALVFDAYIVVNYFSLHPPQSTPESQLFWIRMVMFVASFKGPLLFLLVHTFPSHQIILKRLTVVAVLLVMLTTAGVSLTPLIFESIVYIGNQPTPVQGPGMILFFLDFAGFIVMSLAVMTTKYRNTQDPGEKAQHRYLMGGIFSSLSLIALTSFISVVILGNSSLVFLGPVFLVFLIGSIGYAIVKHQLFKIEIVATNVLVFMLWLVLFSKLFVARSNIELGVDATVFAMIVIFGLLLIGSVKREVRQRELLEELTKKLESSNQKLQELDKLKSEFLSFAAHQVKAPMSIIKGFATLIIDGTYGQVPEKVKETAQKIKDSSDRLIALVSNLLDLRKIQEGHMDFAFEIVDVRRLLQSIVDEMHALAEKRELSLTLESDIQGLALNLDEQKFRQVIQNIIDNAIKYTDKGWIKVRLESDPNVHNATISISDSGRGMSSDLIPHLFEEFTRDKETAKDIAGTGLGLYIAKQIILAHHGEIWVSSEGEGKGSTFYVRLPLP